MRFASTPTTETAPLIPTMIGIVTTCAAIGTTSRSAQPRGTPLRCSAVDHAGASRMSPPVASTDSVNPALTDSCGSTNSNRMTAVASAGTQVRVRPVSSASNAMPPITAARSTEGCGPTSTTRPTRVTDATHRRIPRTEPAEQHDRDPAEHREMRSRHGQQMCDPGRLGIGVQLVGDSAGVTHHQSREETRSITVQPRRRCPTARRGSCAPTATTMALHRRPREGFEPRPSVPGADPRCPDPSRPDTASRSPGVTVLHWSPWPKTGGGRSSMSTARRPPGRAGR